MKTKNRKVSSFERRRKALDAAVLEQIRILTPEEHLLLAIFGVDTLRKEVTESYSHYRFLTHTN